MDFDHKNCIVTKVGGSWKSACPLCLIVATEKDAAAQSREKLAASENAIGSILMQQLSAYKELCRLQENRGNLSLDVLLRAGNLLRKIVGVAASRQVSNYQVDVNHLFNGGLELNLLVDEPFRMIDFGVLSAGRVSVYSTNGGLGLDLYLKDEDVGALLSCVAFPSSATK